MFVYLICIIRVAYCASGRSSSLKQCDITTANAQYFDTEMVSNMLQTKCNNITIHDSVSSALYNILIDARDTYVEGDIPMHITLRDCNASNILLLFGHNNEYRMNANLLIQNTSFGGAFREYVKINNVTFVDCTINITTITGYLTTLTACNISFVRCKFVGCVFDYTLTVNKVKAAMPLNINNFRRKEDVPYNIAFEDCEFALDDSWYMTYYPREDAYVNKYDKYFMILLDDVPTNVNITFTRCYTNNDALNNTDNEIDNKALRLFMNARNRTYSADNISVTGIDNGFDVLCGSSEDTNIKDLINAAWSVCVNNTGYTPYDQTATMAPNFTPDYGDDLLKDDKVDSIWRIIAVALGAAFIVALISLIAVTASYCRRRKKIRYDASSSE